MDTVNAAGFWSVDIKLLGPLQEYDVAPVALPVSISMSLVHNVVAAALAVTEEGADVVMETADVVTLADPQPLIAVRVYTPAAAVPTVNAAGFCDVDE